MGTAKSSRSKHVPEDSSLRREMADATVRRLTFEFSESSQDFGRRQAMNLVRCDFICERAHQHPQPDAITKFERT